MRTGASLFLPRTAICPSNQPHPRKAFRAMLVFWNPSPGRWLSDRRWRLPAQCLFLAALWILDREISGIHFADVMTRLRELPWISVTLSLATCLASYLALAGYDWLALRHIGRRLPSPTCFRAPSSQPRSDSTWAWRDALGRRRPLSPVQRGGPVGNGDRHGDRPDRRHVCDRRIFRAGPDLAARADAGQSHPAAAGRGL